MSYSLSKSALQIHKQCSKRLWLSVHNTEAASKDEMAELLMTRGTAFGEAIRECFPGGHLIQSKNISDAIRETKILFDEFSAGKPRVTLFEAAFAYGDVVIIADVLIPCPDGGWCLLEIKSSVLKLDDAPKQHYVFDVATQAWVLDKCGLRVSRIELGHANNDYRLPNNHSPEGILRRLDVTSQARSLANSIEEVVKSAIVSINQPTEPEQSTGVHCNKPNKCSFIKHCSGAILYNEENIKIPVWHLAGEPTARLVSDLMAQGFRDLAQVPEDKLNKPMHKIMRSIALGGAPYIDDRLRSHLRHQPFPRYFLDYETNNSPLPLWIGTHPGEIIPFQFSLHKWKSLDGPIEHFSYLGDTIDDPRLELARSLAMALEEPGPVFAWNGKSTEGPITMDLALAFPEFRVVLERVANSCRELDPVIQFRDWFYHPAMAGSWGLKAISRALFVESPYKKLRISNGVHAMREYERFLKLAEGEERNKIREALLEYCNTDTEIMIKIWQIVTN